jgi:phage capsid family
MAVLSKGTLFDPKLVTDLINKVKGKSSLAVLSKQVPVPFNGSKEFTFTLDKDVDIVAENGKKSEGGVSVEPVIIRPIKVEYGARVSDEFIYAADEEKINILKAFNEGFAKKVARGIDLMAFHGINPRTKQASDVITTNHFDSLVTQTVTFDKAQIEENIETAVAMIQGVNGEVSGIAMSPVFSQELAKLKVNGVKQYPELAWGANPGIINGLPVDINTTISEGEQVKDRSIIGDFANMFKWGYAKEIPLQVIEYGDPDNSGKDLKGYNQVYLRAEAFIGWGILDAKSFVRIVEA